MKPPMDFLPRPYIEWMYACSLDKAHGWHKHRSLRDRDPVALDDTAEA